MLINFTNLKPSASVEVSLMTSQLKKEGRRVYPLSVGETHFLSFSLKVRSWKKH